MRLAGVAQWLRAAASDPGHRQAALRYAGGITVLQVAWIALLFLPAIALPGSLVLAGLELSVPVWAEGLGRTPWHPHHIAERFQLFTLIVLGESILSATLAVQSGLASGDTLAMLLPTIAGGLLIVFSMWWVYFVRPMHDLLTDFTRATIWGYGHYFVFAAAAATGAGLAVAVDAGTHRAVISAWAATWAVAIPVAVFVLALWVVHWRAEYRRTLVWGPLAAGLILLAPLLDLGVLPIGGIFALLLVLEHAIH
jgi:low temperature requirement protein LtrA